MATMKLRGQFKVVEYANELGGSTSWRVTGTKPDGTRVRENYADQAAALGRKQELETEALNGETAGPKARVTRLTPEQLADAETAGGILAGKWTLTFAAQW